jgi:hypothetical protein
MYDKYSKDVKAMGKKPVSMTWFREHYKAEFKASLKIHPPQLDACGICLQFYGKLKVIKDAVHKELLERFLEKHYKEADARYEKLGGDKAKLIEEDTSNSANFTINHGIEDSFNNQLISS